MSEERDWDWLIEKAEEYLLGLHAFSDTELRLYALDFGKRYKVFAPLVEKEIFPAALKNLTGVGLFQHHPYKISPGGVCDEYWTLRNIDEIIDEALKENGKHEL